MKRIAKLRLCDWSLLILTILMFVSGLQLELNPNGTMMWGLLHIIVGLMYSAGIFWHIQLHKNRRTKGTHKRGDGHAWLGITFLLMLISGIIATVHWYGSFVHSTIGGIHGKLGFLMIIVVFIHVRKYGKFYRKI